MSFQKIINYVAISLISIFLGVVLAGGCASSPGDTGKGGLKSDNLNPPTANAKISDARNTPIVRAAQAVGPAVVGITNKGMVRDFFSRKKVMVEQGQGSGVIFDAAGFIATNYHVVANSSEIMVSLADGRSIPGKVLGVDPATDLAVVKVEEANLPVAVLGDSDTLLVGEPAIAIGNPLGLEFKGSVTTGVISALNRPLDIGERRFKLIQTDAAINPGNSGGALVNADGMVVGINSAKIAYAGVEGIGFAIPINSARPILQSIIERGRVVRAYLGIGALDKSSAEKYGNDLRIEKGVYIVNLAPNGPAVKAGLQPGDIIVKVAGKDVNDLPELRTVLDSQAVGSQVEVVALRKGQPKTFNVRLEEMPAQE